MSHMIRMRVLVIEWLLLIKPRVLVVHMDINHIPVSCLLIWNA